LAALQRIEALLLANSRQGTDAAAFKPVKETR